jgi:hypothetical protein
MLILAATDEYRDPFSQAAAQDSASGLSLVASRLASRNGAIMQRHRLACVVADQG